MVQAGRSRKSKGSVGIEVYQGRLRLRLPRSLYDGRQKYLSLGLDDTPGNRQIAEAKAKQIESDIVYERFDSSLNKYRPEHFKLIEPSDRPKEIPKLDVIWEKFVEYQKKSCSANTIIKKYRQYGNYIAKFPTQNLNDAVVIRDWVIENLPAYSAKILITKLGQCCDWAKDSKIIDFNPFAGMGTKMKLPKNQKGDEITDINPFSAEERDLIIKAFRENTCMPKCSAFQHSPYAPFVEFLFRTGCRTSEAVALQWRHISSDFRIITFEQAVIDGYTGKEVREGLKTQKRRIFPCNDPLKLLLCSIKPEDYNPDDLVFPALKGGFLNTNNFRRRVWTIVLEGLKIEYRRLYQTRHTFITLALENGMVVHDVARAVGNSPEIIYKHYVGNRRDIAIPEF